MKKISFIFILFFIFLSTNIFATHNIAGEIIYEWISGNKYKISVITYSDYVNGQVDPCVVTVDFGHKNANGTQATALLPRINGPSSSKCAHNGVAVNSYIKKNIYEGLHEFPGPGNYKITMDDPNRVANICNIPNSVGTSFSLQSEVVISPFLINKNTSSVLSTLPIDNACVGQCFEHNPGAYDADGDSLSYSLVSCLDKGSSILGYTLPQTMIATNINPYNGDIKWCSPTAVCTVNVAILIKEYKLVAGTNKRIYAGSVLREMQIIIQACNNNAPVITDIKDTCIIAGNNLHFTVTATDPDPTDTLTLSASGGPFISTPIATFTSSPSKSPATGTFDWTPDCGQIRLLPYLATFKVKDNNTKPLVDFESVQIRVIAPPPTNLIATQNGSNVILTWNATICNDTSATSKNPFQGYRIYRKNYCDTIIPGPCETGVPAYWGYTYIGSTNAITTTYTDKGLAFAKNYSYIIEAYYKDGSTSIASANKCINMLALDVPVITNVSVQTTSNSSGSIWVHWVKPLAGPGNFDSIANPPPYECRIMQAQGMNGTLNFSQIYSYNYNAYYQLSDTGYTINNLNTENFAYSYRIDFYSNNTLIGSSSNASSVFLQSSPGNNKVHLTWNEITPWNNYLYHIYRKNSLGNFIKIGTSITKNYTDIGLANGVPQCYYVISEGKYNSSLIQGPHFNYSQIKCETPIDTTAPCQPHFNVEGDCNLNQNTIYWNIPNTGCADDVVQINIYYAPTKSDLSKLIYSTTNLNQTSTIHVNDYQNIPSIAGCYTVTAVDSFGNESKIITTICVDNCPEYTLPNVFTPNGDGNNDMFIPLPYKYVKDIDIKIYDRWGLLMFETNNPDILWDGKNKDTKLPCPDGTYYYVCKVNEIRVEGLKPRILKGYVQLLLKE